MGYASKFMDIASLIVIVALIIIVIMSHTNVRFMLILVIKFYVILA